jgi:hypothetical protein
MALILSGDTGPSFVQRAAMPTGSILQVVQASNADTITVTSTSFVASNLTASITPISSSSRILVMVLGGSSGAFGGQELRLTIYRNSTNLFSNNGASDYYAASGFVNSNMALSIVDSPATTSATTYTLYGRVQSGGQTGYINNASASVLMTLMEIAG